MIRCLDGPAVGVELSCRRAPIYLRVVCDTLAQKWDVLDLPDDSPAPSETVYVYRREPGTWGSSGGFACGRGQGGAGCVELGESGHYRLVADVDGELFRSTDVWREWCLSQPEARPAAETFGAR